MKKSELIKLLDAQYNFANQEEWDNCGVEPHHFYDEDVTGIFISLDMNYDAFNKAIKQNCNVIISHHPILLDELNSNSIINQSNLKLIKQLKAKHIINIALHTCFDQAKNGTSHLLLEALQQKFSFDGQPSDLNPFIKSINLVKPILVSDFINQLKDDTFKRVACLNVNTSTLIQSLAIGAGSCCSMLNEVIDAHIDCFLTGDVKWHNYMDAYNNGLVVIDIQHTTERCFIKAIAQYLKNKNYQGPIVLDYDSLEISYF